MTFVAGMKHADQKRLGKERVHLAYTSCSLSLTDGRKARTPGGNLEAGLKQRPWGNVSHWLVLHDSFSLLTPHTTQGHQPRVALLIAGW